MADLQDVLLAIPGRQALHLDVSGTSSVVELSVVSFTATEKMGAATEVCIVATHPQQLARADYLNLDAVFTIVPDDGVPKKISGFIDRISNVKTSKDLSQYEIILKSHFGRLAAVHNTQIYQHQSTPDIIAAVLRRHGIKDHQMSFRLRNRYLKHLFRFQYRVDDLTYVQMLMQKSGIYSYMGNQQ